MPQVLTHRTSKGRYIECSTLALVKLNGHINSYTDQAMEESQAIVRELIDNIGSKVSAMHSVRRGIALVDMLASFAQLATKHSYVRPQFGGRLALRDARHPILDAVRALLSHSILHCSRAGLTGGNAV